jgi:hypothetical protein
MKLDQKIQEFFLRYFYHSHRIREQTSFPIHIKNARNILIYCPNQNNLTDYRRQLNKVFRRCFINIIYPVSKISQTFVDLKGIRDYPVSSGSIIKTHQFSHFDRLIQPHYDVFIDLDPDPNLVNMYLCRLLQPEITIGYEKAYANFYYNFLIHPQESTPGSDRLRYICSVISCIRTKKRPPKQEQVSLF